MALGSLLGKLIEKMQLSEHQKADAMFEKPVKNAEQGLKYFKDNPREFYEHYKKLEQEPVGESTREYIDRHKELSNLRKGMRKQLGGDYDSWWDKNITQPEKAYHKGRGMFMDVDEAVRGESDVRVAPLDVRDLVATVSQATQTPRAKSDFYEGMYHDDALRRKHNYNIDTGHPNRLFEGELRTWDDIGGQRRSHPSKELGEEYFRDFRIEEAGY